MTAVQAYLSMTLSAIEEDSNFSVIKDQRLSFERAVIWTQHSPTFSWKYFLINQYYNKGQINIEQIQRTELNDINSSFHKE